MARDKIHPLWYTEFIPILFFVSSVFAGLSLVIIEGAISHRVFADQIPEDHHASEKDITIGLAKGAAAAMFAYFFLKLLIFIHEHHWAYIATPMGWWYLVEMIGFVAIPCAVFVEGIRTRSVTPIRVAAVLAALGIILNRLNVSVIAFGWNYPTHYYPSWIEIVITMTVILTEIWVFRWVILRMPVLSKSPDWVEEDH
jgi:Ni/Fe-hydrogenase subunit HybB-like protein